MISGLGHIAGGDDDFRDESAGGEAGYGEGEVAEVFGLEHTCAQFGRGDLGALVEDGGIDFAGVDIGDADAFGGDLEIGEGSDGGLGELGGGVGDAGEGEDAATGDGDDIDDEAVLALPHGWECGVEEIEGAGGIDGEDAVEVFG
jgi:hypothetical protein